MKTKENQDVKYNRIFLALCLVGLCAFVALPSWTRQRDEENALAARQHAEVLGYQVFELYSDAAQGHNGTEMLSSRSPASMKTMGEMASFKEAGSIGMDPWGQPYRYKILNASNTQLKLQIWSAGPNRIFETPDEPGVGQDVYKGDDVGVTLSIANKATQ